MVLVFYIVLGILLLLILLILMIYISKLEIDIENLCMNNINKRKNNEQIVVNISLKIYKCRWIHFRLNKDKMANLYAKIKKSEYKNRISSKMIKDMMTKETKIILENQELKGKILDTKIELDKFNANISLGTEDYILTSYVVAIVAIIISNILPHVIKNREKNILKRVKYRVLPIYQPKNIYKVELSTILSIKISHLTQIAYMLKKVNKEYRKDKEKKYKNIDNVKKRDVQTV